MDYMAHHLLYFSLLRYYIFNLYPLFVQSKRIEFFVRLTHKSGVPTRDHKLCFEREDFMRNFLCGTEKLCLIAIARNENIFFIELDFM